MPTYEYECTRCGIIIEEFKPISAPRRQRCPECRGRVERLISGGSGVVFKGSGFYINDSRGKKGEAPSANSPAGPKDAGSKGKNSGPAATEAKT